MKSWRKFFRKFYQILKTLQKKMLRNFKEIRMKFWKKLLKKFENKVTFKEIFRKCRYAF